MYPKCEALKQAIAQKEWTPAKLAKEVSDRYGTKRANGSPFDGFYIQGLITGDEYAPDSLREKIARVLGQKVKVTFPEYLIECRMLALVREGENILQSDLAEQASEYAFKIIRSLDISAYERGHRFCHPDTREAIAKALNLPVNELFPEYADFCG